MSHELLVDGRLFEVQVFPVSVDMSREVDAIQTIPFLKHIAP
jgi:hypothetical protein